MNSTNILDTPLTVRQMHHSIKEGLRFVPMHSSICSHHLLINITKILNNNETILLEFDKLLMQLSKLSDGTQADSDDLVVFKDVVNNMKQLL